MQAKFNRVYSKERYFVLVSRESIKRVFLVGVIFTSCWACSIDCPYILLGVDYSPPEL